MVNTLALQQPKRDDAVVQNAVATSFLPRAGDDVDEKGQTDRDFYASLPEVIPRQLQLSFQAFETLPATANL